MKQQLSSFHVIIFKRRADEDIGRVIYHQFQHLPSDLVTLKSEKNNIFRVIKGDFGVSSPSLSLCPSMNAVVLMTAIQHFILNECKKIQWTLFQ